MTAMWYGKRHYEYEVDRYYRTDRMANLKDKPAHHFSNRGGVLVEK